MFMSKSEPQHGKEQKQMLCNGKQKFSKTEIEKQHEKQIHFRLWLLTLRGLLVIMLQTFYCFCNWFSLYIIHGCMYFVAILTTRVPSITFIKIGVFKNGRVEAIKRIRYYSQKLYFIYIFPGNWIISHVIFIHIFGFFF